MTLTRLIDLLRDAQAKHGGDMEVWLGQASGPDLKAEHVRATVESTQTRRRVTIYPPVEGD